MRKKVDVVALIICKGEKILLEKRKENRRNDPSKIAIPGGHVKKGESFLEACRRELEEELDLQCKEFTFVIEILHSTPSEEQVVHYYSCDNWKGTPKCIEAERIFWVDTERLESLDFEEDRQAVTELLNTRGLDISH